MKNYMKTYNLSVRSMTDGNRTVTHVHGFDLQSENVEVEGLGSAGREPGDKNDSEVGDKLALARALRSAAAHLERQANGRIRHTEEIKRHRAEIAAKMAAAWDVDHLNATLDL